MESHSKDKLWQRLEQKIIPDKHSIYELSGLLDDDINRFEHLWETLPLATRLSLVTQLKEIAEVDFAVDFTAIFNIALDSEDPSICIAAMEGMVDIEDIMLLPRFTHLLQHNANPAVRATAAQSLDRFVYLGEFGKILEKHYTHTLKILLETFCNPDEKNEVKRRALESLAYSSHSDIAQLIKEAYSSPDENLRISAVFSMGRSADTSWADIVIAELHNTSPEMRFEATRSCGELRLQDALLDLIDLTDDADIEVQEMAIWSLGQLGGKRARSTIEGFTDSDNEALSAAAAHALAELDFFENGIDSFLGPPSEFNGEGDGDWFTPEGFLNYDDNEDDFEEVESEENLWDQ